MTISPNKTSLTFYVPLSLKLRIDMAAALDERSTSQYLVRLLEKIVPQSKPPAQIDIDEQIALDKHTAPTGDTSVLDERDSDDLKRAFKKAYRSVKAPHLRGPVIQAHADTNGIAKPKTARRNRAIKKARHAK
jgi:hypothetical protein